MNTRPTRGAPRPEAQARPKAQARPRPDFWKFWKSGTWKFGIQKYKKIKILKIQIRSAQNVGKVWISRKKNLPAPFGVSRAIFCVGWKNQKNDKILAISGACKQLPGMAPNGAGRFFFRLIQTLPTFWAERILILRIFIFWIFWKP